jgi:hypothetical protein
VWLGGPLAAGDDDVPQGVCLAVDDEFVESTLKVGLGDARFRGGDGLLEEVVDEFGRAAEVRNLGLVFPCAECRGRRLEVDDVLPVERVGDDFVLEETSGAVLECDPVVGATCLPELGERPLCGHHRVGGVRVDEELGLVADDLSDAARLESGEDERRWFVGLQGQHRRSFARVHREAGQIAERLTRPDEGGSDVVGESLEERRAPVCVLLRHVPTGHIGLNKSTPRGTAGRIGCPADAGDEVMLSRRQDRHG